LLFANFDLRADSRKPGRRGGGKSPSNPSDGVALPRRSYFLSGDARSPLTPGRAFARLSPSPARGEGRVAPTGSPGAPNRIPLALAARPRSA